MMGRAPNSKGEFQWIFIRLNSKSSIRFHFQLLMLGEHKKA